MQLAVKIRSASPEDADVCGTICYEAFSAINHAHNFPPDFPSAEVGVGRLRMLFSHPHFYCVVAEIDNQIVGSNCLDERSIIGGIGPISISPGFQNRKIGAALMQAVIDRARECQLPGIRLLQAAFHNRSLSLYTKLGFDAREPVSVMQGQPIRQSIEGLTVREARETDVEAANRICEQVHGYNRSRELRDGIRQGAARVVERHGQITGYASALGFRGHAVGQSNLDLQAFIATADHFEEPGILVPTRNSQLLRWCLQHGLRVLYPMTLMSIGLYNEPCGAYLPSIFF
jgi:predicted N-acetyltransferase YhbS